MPGLKYSPVIQIPEARHGEFSAFQARHNTFGGLMSPVLGFDHFRMKKDVFGAHKHMHMSAISYLFEDSVPYHNQDSMGTDLIITPGSLLWTWAGKGVVHHEVPTVEGREVHGLQLFLDIPPENRALPPRSIYIPVETMPVVSADGLSVKVAMGSAGDAVNTNSTPEPVTLLDIQLNAGKTTDYTLPAGWNGTIYLLSGTLQLNSRFTLNKNEAVSFGTAGIHEKIILAAGADSRLLLISGPPVTGNY
ncbi:MAG TPA: pirin family protein [Chitinophaga sp.]|nr:pirin family protein [Chitinophaga sp.]